MKSNWKSKTTVYKYDGRTIVHTINKLDQKPIFFSDGKDTPFEWDDGGYIDLDSVPKPSFISKFKNRVKNFFNQNNK